MKCNAYLENRCRSCSLLNLSYQESLTQKEKNFKELITHFKIENYLPIVGLKEVIGSRNKAKLAVQLIDGEIQFGILDQKQQFYQLEDCPLHILGINELLVVLKKYFQEFNIVPYDLKNQKGELKYIILTKSDSTQELMVRFILRSKESLDRLKKLALKLQGFDQKIVVLSANIQSEHKAILEGEEEIVLSQKNYITHRYNELELHLGVKSFFQVTSQIARQLYFSVAEFLKEQRPKQLLDLYCGVGAFSLYAHPYVDHVYGVEISQEAIYFANQAKMANNIFNVSFESLDVDQFLKRELNKFDAILVNPPRRGVGIKSMEHLLKMQPQFLIYSSCNAQTLVQDLEILKADYTIHSAQIFDMFPYTNHYEVLVILKKSKK